MHPLRLTAIVGLLVFTACQCGRQPPKQALSKEGEACQSDELCETGLCDAAPGFAPVCVRKCADGCLVGEVCVQLTPNRFACQPDQRKLCQPCNTDGDCPYPSDKCLVVNNERVCGRDCAFDQNCPDGYRCVNGQGVDGTPKVQQCVPINASCACLARGDFQQACQTTNAFGTCLGIKQCDLVSNEVVCDAREAGAETCNGLDDDCDGEVDEGIASTSCGVGQCARQVESCTDGGVVTCVPGQPTTEVCNELDDDCDGTPDNGFDKLSDVMNCRTCGNVCALPNAVPRCAGGNCEVDACVAPHFQNCNGLHPDGCEVDTRSDSSHCGQCGFSCSRPNSTATCQDGGCVFQCADGYRDLNGDVADGCEYQCPVWPAATVDLPDLQFVDANCDGIDGEVLNGVFVSPAGNDANAGTRAAPKRTIANALTTLFTSGKRDVYVAEGTYTGPLTLAGVSGVNVAGGYHGTTWQRSSGNATTIQGGNPALDIDGANNVLVQTLRFEGANGDVAKPSAYGGVVKESQGIRLEGLELRAGNGRTGTSGSTPPVAANGSVGTGGREGCYNDPRTSPVEIALACNFDLFLPYCPSARPGGAGGLTNCGAQGTSQGGSGGSPTRYNPSGTPTGGAGGAGSPAGGAGGQGVPYLTTPSMGSAYWGTNGANGANGSNGAGATTGSFSASGYVLPAAGDGTAGGIGRGGGGGGGGAGGQGNPLGGLYAGIQCYAYGSAGSGGGSGGCGGGAGTAGASGGASIGLFLHNANVTAQASVIRSGNGGTGGSGGAGRTGGTGANGGTSAYDSAQGEAARGGGGGRGGNGGNGGHGGGGAGGPVYGVVRNTGSTWSPTGGSIHFGTPGAGGTSLGNAGAAGASGVQLTY